MMRYVAFLVLFAACGKAPQNTPTIVLEVGTAALRVEVAGIKKMQGHLGCALFNSAEGFPGASPIVDQGFLLTVTAADMTCNFVGLPPGEYAVSVFHDENDDGVLGTSVVGAPTEGYGATNNVYHATSAPTWAESKVSLAAGQTLTPRIDMHY